MGILEVSNMSFRTGMELKVAGVIRSHPRRFSINVGHSRNDIALHFNPRFQHHGDKGTIVMNSRQGGSWKEEQRESNFPFEPEQEFEVTIVFNFDTFDIYLSNGHMVQFPNRIGDMKYGFIFFAGAAKIQDISVKPSEKPTKRCMPSVCY